MHATIQARRRNRGFVGITTALVITGMLAFAGLAFDVGYIEWSRMGLQSAADAAAMGALRELELGNNGNLTAAGVNDASLNGFTNGVRNTTVAINNPPTSGSYQGDSHAVEAIITRTVPTFFMMIVGQNSLSMSARAVGRTTSSSGSIGGCVFGLDQTAKRAIQIAGAPNVTVACSLVVNSNNNEAFEMEGSETLHLGSHAKVGVYGGWQLNGQSVIDDEFNKPTNPVQINARVNDPLASVPVPSAGSVVSTHSVTYDMNNKPGGGSTLSPGVYCGGMSINNTGGVTFKMTAGTYIMAGGGLRFQSQAIIDATAGVTIYNTSASASHMWGCSSTSSYAPVSIDGQANLTMKAPVSGALTGIAFFEDRDTAVTGTNPTSNPNKIVGGANTKIDGALYFKNTQLQFSGTNSATGYMVIVADMVQINGNSTFGNNYSSLSSSNYFAPQSTGGGLAE
jgi:Flp pilus assembly protein TadG